MALLRKSKKLKGKESTPVEPVPPRIASDEQGESETASVRTPEMVNKERGEEDYLRKYEWHKPTGYPYFMVSGVKYSPPSVGSKAEKMKKFLLEQPRVRVFVPRTVNESPKVLQTVNLNGYRLDFPKNTYIEMPEQIAEVLRRSLAQTEDALNQFRIDREGFNDSPLQ